MATKIQVRVENERRIWNTLPDDVLSVIFAKFGPIQILKLYSWSVVHGDSTPSKLISTAPSICETSTNKTRAMVESVLKRSGGELIQLSAGPFPALDISILHNVVEKSNSIKRIQLHLDHDLELHKVVDLAGKVASIQELDLCCISSAAAKTIEKVTKSCPKLKLKLLQGQGSGYGWCPCTMLSDHGLEITGGRRLRLVFSIQAKQSEKEQHSEEVTSWIDHPQDKESNIACITTLGH